MRQAWNARNIIQIGWHWCVPATTEDAFDTSGGKRYIDSYSYNTRAFGVRNALKEGTWQNAEMKKQLKQVAGFLKLLQDAGIAEPGSGGVTTAPRRARNFGDTCTGSSPEPTD